MRLAAAMLAVLHGAAWAAVTESDSQLTYDVRQSDGTTLLQALNAASPVRENGRTFHAYTQWHVQWRYRYRTLPGGQCAIASVDTQLTVTMTLPVLKSSTDEVAREFARYYPAVLDHEEGHRRVGQGAAREVDAAIAGLAPMVSCELLGAEANRQGLAIVQRANQQDKDYDEATRHGCTQNACLKR